LLSNNEEVSRTGNSQQKAWKGKTLVFLGDRTWEAVHPSSKQWLPSQQSNQITEFSLHRSLQPLARQNCQLDYFQLYLLQALVNLTASQHCLELLTTPAAQTKTIDTQKHMQVNWCEIAIDNLGKRHLQIHIQTMITLGRLWIAHIEDIQKPKLHHLYQTTHLCRTHWGSHVLERESWSVSLSRV
jgi:hypothetical protein